MLIGTIAMSARSLLVIGVPSDSEAQDRGEVHHGGFMTQDERIQSLEKNLAEAVDILRHLCWGHHADNVHTRVFDLLDKVDEQANKIRLDPVNRYDDGEEL